MKTFPRFTPLGGVKDRRQHELHSIFLGEKANARKWKNCFGQKNDSDGENIPRHPR